MRRTAFDDSSDNEFCNNLIIGDEDEDQGITAPGQHLASNPAASSTSAITPGSPAHDTSQSAAPVTPKLAPSAPKSDIFTSPPRLSTSKPDIFVSPPRHSTVTLDISKEGRMLWPFLIASCDNNAILMGDWWHILTTTANNIFVHRNRLQELLSKHKGIFCKRNGEYNDIYDDLPKRIYDIIADNQGVYSNVSERFKKSDNTFEPTSLEFPVTPTSARSSIITREELDSYTISMLSNMPRERLLQIREYVAALKSEELPTNWSGKVKQKLKVSTPKLKRASVSQSESAAIENDFQSRHVAHAVIYEKVRSLELGRPFKIKGCDHSQKADRNKGSLKTRINDINQCLKTVEAKLHDDHELVVLLKSFKDYLTLQYGCISKALEYFPVARAESSATVTMMNISVSKLVQQFHPVAVKNNTPITHTPSSDIFRMQHERLKRARVETEDDVIEITTNTVVTTEVRVSPKRRRLDSFESPLGTASASASSSFPMHSRKNLHHALQRVTNLRDVYENREGDMSGQSYGYFPSFLSPQFSNASHSPRPSFFSPQAQGYLPSSLGSPQFSNASHSPRPSFASPKIISTSLGVNTYPQSSLDISPRAESIYKPVLFSAAQSPRATVPLFASGEDDPLNLTPTTRIGRSMSALDLEDDSQESSATASNPIYSFRPT